MSTPELAKTEANLLRMTDTELERAKELALEMIRLEHRNSIAAFSDVARAYLALLAEREPVEAGQ